VVWLSLDYELRRVRLADVLGNHPVARFSWTLPNFRQINKPSGWFNAAGNHTQASPMSFWSLAPALPATCPQSVSPAGNKRMTEAMFLKALNALRAINWTGTVGYIHFNEPLLDKRIVDLVKLTKEILPGSSPAISTNGDALTFSLMDRLVKAGLWQITISNHDSPEPWRGDILSMAKRWPDHVVLFDVQSEGGMGADLRGGFLDDGLMAGMKFYAKTWCTTPEASLRITTDGHIILCCCDYKHEHVFGHIDEGILNVWNKPEFKRVRDEVRAGRPRLDICRGCFGLQKNTL
jgi:hypothetical protein